MAEGIQQEGDSSPEVIRARRVEVLDAHDRVRVVIGQIEEHGPYGLPGFGLRLLGPDGSTRADMVEDATGVCLTIVVAGNEVLLLGADDSRILVADDGQQLAHMAAGEHSEVSAPGAYLTLCKLDGAAVLGWHVTPGGSVERARP